MKLENEIKPLYMNQENLLNIEKKGMKLFLIGIFQK
nr:MAG TPA: hypothetical protein [Bacteriophage sp.]DAI39990.1 MAG TPA: hypothetical protein [Caudoviricetes sp.]